MTRDPTVATTAATVAQDSIATGAASSSFPPSVKSRNACTPLSSSSGRNAITLRRTVRAAELGTMTARASTTFVQASIAEKRPMVWERPGAGPAA